MFGKSIIFFYKALLFGLSAYLVIPKNEFKRYLIFGFFFGAIGDVIVIIILAALNLIEYKNMGPFSVFGLFSFWTPIAWMFAFMLFFYFLPVRKVFFYPYIIGFALFGQMVGSVLQKLGLYQQIGNYIYYGPILFIFWFYISAYLYLKIGGITLQSNIRDLK